MDPVGQHVAGMIASAVKAYAAGVSNRQVDRQPEVLTHYGTHGFVDLSGDTELRLLYLGEALAAGRPKLFSDQIAWQKTALTARQVPIGFLEVNLSCLRDEVLESLPEKGGQMAADYVDAAREVLARAPDTLPTLLADGTPHVDLARRYLLAALETRRSDALQLIRDALRDGLTMGDIHEHVIVRVQGEVGRMWQMGEVHVAEEHYASTIAEEVLQMLRLESDLTPSEGRRVLCTTVGGDLHDIAIRVVSNEFEARGWTSILLGASTPTPDLMHAIVDFEANLVAISAATALHIRATADLVEHLRAHPACADIPLMVGGPPFNAIPDLWEVVGADGYARTATEAVEVGRALVEARGASS